MSCRVGPNIVEDGLVLHLDARNIKSYFGTGTIWYDTSGNNNHATLLDVGGNVSFSSEGFFQHSVIDYFGAIDSSSTATTDKGGYWTIPHSESLNPNNTQNWSISSFINIQGDQSVNGGGWYCKRELGVNFEMYGTGIRANAGDGWSQMYYNTQAYQNQFALYTAVFTQTAGVYGTDPGKIEFYINGNLVFTDVSFTPTIDSGQTVRLCRRDGHYQHFFKGQIVNFNVYDKALTPQEVKQNFNALRGRFNI